MALAIAQPYQSEPSIRTQPNKDDRATAVLDVCGQSLLLLAEQTQTKMAYTSIPANAHSPKWKFCTSCQLLCFCMSYSLTDRWSLRTQIQPLRLLSCSACSFRANPLQTFPIWRWFCIDRFCVEFTRIFYDFPLNSSINLENTEQSHPKYAI